MSGRAVRHGNADQRNGTTKQARGVVLCADQSSGPEWLWFPIVFLAVSIFCMVCLVLGVLCMCSRVFFCVFHVDLAPSLLHGPTSALTVHDFWSRVLLAADWRIGGIRNSGLLSCYCGRGWV
jgi:hypothetical protein